mmetsp:Transcript_16873/g.27749  ORF Transcript_16873/g.27749 Transcript_16873/m.27749 type:complete len:263 (+) Transcript_16873:197-985(+)
MITMEDTPPGPGQYNARSTFETAARKGDRHGSGLAKRFNATLESTWPSPSQYEIKSSFERAASPAPRTRRTNWNMSENIFLANNKYESVFPGPGSYTPASTFKDTYVRNTQHRPTSLFGTRTRFSNCGDTGPGPDYTTRSTFERAANKSPSGRQTVWGVGGHVAPKDSLSQPGPGAYTMETVFAKAASKPTEKRPSSSFGTDNRHHFGLKDLNVPSPVAYPSRSTFDGAATINTQKRPTSVFGTSSRWLYNKNSKSPDPKKT